MAERVVVQATNGIIYQCLLGYYGQFSEEQMNTMQISLDMFTCGSDTIILTVDPLGDNKFHVTMEIGKIKITIEP